MALNMAQFQSLAEQLILLNRPFLVTGPPGIGKTDGLKQVTEKIQFDLYVSMPAIDAPEDYKGFGFFQDGGADFFPMGMLREIMESNPEQPAVWFFDDLGQAPIAVQNAIMQLVHPRNRMLNNQKIPPHVRIIAASNRRKDNAGVVGMTDPLKGRFTTIVELQPDIKSWTEWAIRAGIDPMVIGFLHYSPDSLVDFKPNMDFEQSPTPRGWEGISELRKLSMPVEIRHEVFSGSVGRAKAAEFIGFEEILHDLPDLDMIERDGEKTPLPNNVNGFYAVTGALSTRGKEEDKLEQVCLYMNRLPTEYRVLWANIWSQRNEAMLETQPWTEWIAENGAAMVG